MHIRNSGFSRLTQFDRSDINKHVYLFDSCELKLPEVIWNIGCIVISGTAWYRRDQRRWERRRLRRWTLAIGVTLTCRQRRWQHAAKITAEMNVDSGGYVNTQRRLHHWQRRMIESERSRVWDDLEDLHSWFVVYNIPCSQWLFIDYFTCTHLRDMYTTCT